MALDLDKIEASAKAATPDWSGADLIDIGTFFNETVEEHLAGLDPQTVLALVAAIRTERAECARLCTVVEKLRNGLELIVGKSRTMEEILWRDFTDDQHVTVTVDLGRYRQVASLLTETASDVTADEGRAGC